MRKKLSFFIAIIILIFCNGYESNAQQYKLRQSSGMMGMNSESTVYVKGMRKRTESAGIMGMSVPVTIEQCDLQRTIKINDKKKIFFIEPFTKEEVIDDDVKAVASKTKPVAQPKTTTQTGGVITMWYTITDTGERKKMNGFTARHVWITQKIKPSADACMMKDSMVVKTDGWYIDLPEFNCPIHYTPQQVQRPTEKVQPQCKDRFVSHRKGKGKLGFPLTETRTMIMGGSAKATEFTTNLETLEFSSQKLDSMLFEIPKGYAETMDESDLQDKLDMKDAINEYKNQNKDNGNTTPTEQKKPGAIRIGVYQPKGDDQLQSPVLQKHLVGSLSTGNIESIAIASEEDAKKYNCDYTLATDFTRIKQANKVGGLLKAIKNADPNAASSYNIEATLILVSIADGSVRVQPKINSKYDGKIDDAAMKALDDGSRQVLKSLK